LVSCGQCAMTPAASAGLRSRGTLDMDNHNCLSRGVQLSLPRTFGTLAGTCAYTMPSN
jgi:hypothetical protein